MTVTIHQGDALAVLRTLPSNSVHCVVTSPPYWGLRDYQTGTWEGGGPECDHVAHEIRTGLGMAALGEKYRGGGHKAGDAAGKAIQFRALCGKCGARRIDQQIGLEATPDAWCARLVEVFREVRRVLRPDGVMFLNCGDSYAASTKGAGGEGKQHTNAGSIFADRRSAIPPGLKPKDLIGAPWLLAFALRADGWWLRSEIIWSKPNPMPESVTDRPTKAHEQVFLLTKSARYFWDAEAVREPLKPGADHDRSREYSNGTGNPNRWSGDTRVGTMMSNPAGRNMRSVWTIATDPLPSVEVDGEKLDHFASYPVELARRCILAGTSAKGCCPECGAPWARVVEASGGLLGRDWADGGDKPRLVNIPHRPGSDRQQWDTYRRETTGWSQTCSCIGKNCPVECMKPQPCVVLDPFLGSGRTALAAEELGRDCIGIELNPASVRMARAQLERAKARRMIGDADRVPVPAGQLRFDL